LARNVGKIMGEFKRATGDLRSTFEGHLRDLEREADQRRTPSASTSTPSRPSTSPAASPVVTMPEPLPIASAPGTVATMPPHLHGIGTPAEESSALDAPQPDAPQNVTTPENAPSEPLLQPPTLESEHHPETLTDAGTRPA
jgi:hypothetical protein